MITCTKCDVEMGEGNFSPQKTNPAKLYRWCDGCRANAASVRKPYRNYRREVQEMREKARSMMKLDAKEVREIRILAELGQTQKVIAQQYNVNHTTVNRIINRVGLYGEM